MHVVIGGCGRLGSQLTIELNRLGHTVSVVDKRKEAFEKLPPGFEGQTLVGTVFDRETLETAGIKIAEAYIAATSGDNSNIVSARVAREAFNTSMVIARIYDPRRAEIYQRLGIRTISTVTWAQGQIFDALFGGREQAELAFSDGTLVLLRVPIGPPLAGKAVNELNEENRSSVVAVDRAGTSLLPGPKTAFQEGDVVHIAVRRDAINDLRARLEGGH